MLLTFDDNRALLAQKAHAVDRQKKTRKQAKTQSESHRIKQSTKSIRDMYKRKNKGAKGERNSRER